MPWTYRTPDELYHYGVLGMKWGKRRNRSTISNDYTRAKELKKKGMKNLSNNELQELNNRRNLERNYKQLNPGIGKKVLVGLGTTAAIGGNIMAIKNNAPQIANLAKSTVSKIKNMKLYS